MSQHSTSEERAIFSDSVSHADQERMLECLLTSVCGRTKSNESSPVRILITSIKDGSKDEGEKNGSSLKKVKNEISIVITIFFSYYQNEFILLENVQLR